MKKRRKLKKKVYISMLICLIGILGTGILYIFLDNRNNNLIKKKYDSYVITVREATLYNQKKKKIGTISKDYVLELEKNTIHSLKNIYFQIKNTNYYINCQDIKNGTEIKTEDTKEYELPANQTLTSKKEITLYQEDQKVLTLSSNITLPLAYETEDEYFVYFQNQLLKTKKNNNIKITKNQKEKTKEAEQISILYYESISPSCEDDNCTTEEDFKNQIIKLIENGYYTIDRSDLEKFLNHSIRLKEKAILLTTSNPINSLKEFINEKKIHIENIEEEMTLQYMSVNKPVTKETKNNFVNRYQIKKDTKTEEILKMAEGEEVSISTNQNQAIAVLNYHFFYDKAGGEVCGESICLDTAKFREHLDYLKENHYKTLTMDEFKRWMYGEIELPTKSVLITVDDGAMGTGKDNGNKLIPLLEEYKMHATLFLIAGWWNIENYRSPNLDIQSHTYDMHLYGDCGRGQINCATYEQAKTDLEKSLAIIQNDDSFCFPFYMYSDTSLKAVKDAGFKLAFVGGLRKATRNNNKYLIPRYPIHSDITLERFIEMVS